ASLDRISKATARVLEPAKARVIRVSSTPTFSLYWLVPRFAQFQALHPALEVTLSTARLPVEQAALSHDVIIRRRPMRWDGFACRPFLQDFLVLACAPHLAAAKPIAAI